MADSKISALSALTGLTVDDLDEFVAVDKSDTAMAASGTNKKITLADLYVAIQKRDVGVDIFTMQGALMP